MILAAKKTCFQTHYFQRNFFFFKKMFLLFIYSAVAGNSSWCLFQICLNKLAYMSVLMFTVPLVCLFEGSRMVSPCQFCQTSKDYRDMKFLQRLSAAALFGTLMSSSGLAYALSLGWPMEHCLFFVFQMLGVPLAMNAYGRTHLGKMSKVFDVHCLALLGMVVFYPPAECFGSGASA